MFQRFGGTKPLFIRFSYIHTHSFITFAEFRSSRSGRGRAENRTQNRLTAAMQLMLVIAEKGFFSLNSYDFWPILKRLIFFSMIFCIFSYMMQPKLSIRSRRTVQI
jgi:hypothetical protein